MPRKTFTSMAEASVAAVDQGISTVAAWRTFARSEAGVTLRVPVNPQIVYAGTWKGWASFLQADQRVSRPTNKGLRPFAEAREHARSLGFTTPREWQAYALSLPCPLDLPADPARAYADKGWAGYPDFLGYNPATGGQKSFWLFSAARAHVRKLRLAGAAAYREWARTDQRPAGIPTHPERTYATRWKGWQNFLGDKPPRIPRRRPGPASKLYSLKDARAAASDLGLKSIREWDAYVRSEDRDPRFPVRPDTRYRNQGWKGWPDFLGTPAVASRAKSRSLLPFEKARVRVRDMRLRNAKDYLERGISLDPERLPIRPEIAYAKKGWKGWRDYLGKAETAE